MILVTGANGLVGSFLCKELIGKGYKVRAFVRKDSDCTLLNSIKHNIDFAYGDVLDVGSIIDAMADVEQVVHTAAIISFWPKMHAAMHQVNVVGTRNIVDVALEQKVNRFIHISSIAAIGRKSGDKQINETNTWEASAFNSEYANTKHQAELEVCRATEEGLNTIILNPSIILGPGLKGSSSFRLFEYVEQENKYYTEGQFNYVDVRDLCTVIEFFTSSIMDSGERFIVNSGSTTYQTFFNQVALVLGVTPPKKKATQFIREIAWRLEAVKAFITGKEPLITKSTAKSALNLFEYQSNKLIKRTNISFRSLDETIQWTCAAAFRK
jgi:dihydroflavonol-4-reductase